MVRPEGVSKSLSTLHPFLFIKAPRSDTFFHDVDAFALVYISHIVHLNGASLLDVIGRNMCGARPLLVADRLKYDRTDHPGRR